jgi:TatD DNase family protein
MIDTHCHLQTAQFDSDREAVIAEAEAAGVMSFVVPAIDIESFEATLAIANSYPNIHCALGIHPHSASEWSGEIGQKIVTEIRSNPKVVAVGEIGLDYFYDFAPRDVQITAFREQIALAQSLQKPVIIHTRDCIPETLDIVEDCYKHTPKTYIFGQFHCFSGTPAQMKKAVELGFYVSYTGNITFKNSGLTETVRETPLDAMMLETDSPYLAPVPHRGKRNSPAFLPLVAQKVAEIKQLTSNEVMAATTTNAKKLFFPALVAALFLLLCFSSDTSYAQVGSRPPDSVMTKDRRDAEEMIKKQKEELLRMEQERKQDSIRSAQQELEEQRKEILDQARKDSIKAVERLQDEEKARIKAQTPIPWKAITVGAALGVGNLELSQSKSRITPSSVLSTTFSIGTQISRIIDFEISLNNFTVEDDLVQDRLYSLGDSTPAAYLDTSNRPKSNYRSLTYESINTSYIAFDVRFVFTPRSPLKFYSGLGYTATTITNKQTYDDVDSLGNVLAKGKQFESSFTSGGIQAMIGARYDLELNDQFILTPYAQIGAAFLFNGGSQPASLVFRVDPEQIVFTHTKVGLTLSFGWFTVDRYK